MTRIPELRERAALTQQELASKAGLSIRTLAYIEAGRDAKATTLQKIAAALDVSLTDLFTEEGAA